MSPKVDPTHWLYSKPPRAWLNAAMEELSRVHGALSTRDHKGALATCRRAAGLALNAMLSSADTLDVRYGRSYMDHILALSEDIDAPEAVRNAAKILINTPLPSAQFTVLRTVRKDNELVEATKDIMAHSLALLLRTEPLTGPKSTPPRPASN